MNRVGSLFFHKAVGLISVCIALAAANLLTFAHQPAFGLTALLWLGLLFPVLGGTVLSLTTPQNHYRPAAWTAYTTGIGMAAIMFAGLAANTAGLLYGFKAIDRHVLVPVFDIVIAGLSILWFARFARNGMVHFFPATPPVPHKIRLALPMVLPLLTAAGAFRLNNGAGNGLAVAALVLVCGYAVYSAFHAKGRHPWWYATHLSAIALALALSVSLRSNHLLGFDINQEYQVFSAVLQQGIWQPHFLDGAYNACLSITILPAILGTLIPIPPEYIFKLVMQASMAIIPLVAFVIAARRFKANRQLAYLTGLFFIAQSQFIFQFPGLIRQQVALLFFGLIFMTVTEQRFSVRQKNAYALLFGTAMVLAHYSTTYIGIVLLGLLVCARPAVRWVLSRTNSQAGTPAAQPVRQLQFSALLVPVLLLITFLWYGQLLQATGGIVEKVGKSVTSLNETFREDSRSDFLVDALGLNNFARDPAKLQSVYQAQNKPYAYQPTAQDYTPEVRSSAGPVITTAAGNAVYTAAHKVLPLALNLLLLAGIAMTIGIFLLRGRLGDEALLGAASGIVFTLIVVLPGLSQAYNIDRLYQQLLLLIGPAAIYALMAAVRYLPRAIAAVAPVLAIALFMVSASGLGDQLAFKFSNVNLTNDGAVYDHYYVTDGEVASLQWMEQAAGSANIHIDRYALLPATAYTTIDKRQLRQGVLPTEIGTGDYVYASSANSNKGLAFGYYQNRVFTFNFPDEYLSGHKNIVYANGQSRIYK